MQLAEITLVILARLVQHFGENFSRPLTLTCDDLGQQRRDALPLAREQLLELASGSYQRHHWCGFSSCPPSSSAPLVLTHGRRSRDASRRSPISVCDRVT